MVRGVYSLYLVRSGRIRAQKLKIWAQAHQVRKSYQIRGTIPLYFPLLVIFSLLNTRARAVQRRNFFSDRIVRSSFRPTVLSGLVGVLSDPAGLYVRASGRIGLRPMDLRPTRPMRPIGPMTLLNSHSSRKNKASNRNMNHFSAPPISFRVPWRPGGTRF